MRPIPARRYDYSTQCVISSIAASTTALTVTLLDITQNAPDVPHRTRTSLKPPSAYSMTTVLVLDPQSHLWYCSIHKAPPRVVLRQVEGPSNTHRLLVV